jgi:RNA polymerase sigma factor (TIGR02999 family)
MEQDDITRLLHEIRSGRQESFDRLIARVYPELKQIANARIRDQHNAQTLNPTGLLHEAYLRMVRYQDVDWKGRAHFFGAAASTMRRVLIDRARAKASEKRSAERVTLVGQSGDEPDGDFAPGGDAGLTMEQMIELDDALNRLAEHRPRWVRMIECRYFGGLTIEETAEVLGVSHGTVSSDWQVARAWLRRELNPN